MATHSLARLIFLRTHKGTAFAKRTECPRANTELGEVFGRALGKHCVDCRSESPEQLSLLGKAREVTDLGGNLNSKSTPCFDTTTAIFVLYKPKLQNTSM